MPFPWKKAKCTRISQLVADHLHSPKRGGSLVVETGFPTSVVDLFVKNRDRLKKSTKKRFEAAASPDPAPSPPLPSRSFEPPVISGTSAAPCTPPPNSPLILSSQPPNISSVRLADEVVTVQRVSTERASIGAGRLEGNGEGVVANGIFLAILKVFLVVILVMATRTFVVAITMSAFLLLFMDYAAKHSFTLAKPCVDAEKSPRYLIGRVACFVGIKMNNLEEVKGFKSPEVQKWKKERPYSDDSIRVTQVVGTSNLIEEHKMNDPFQEIQIVQTSSYVESAAQEIQNVKSESNLYRVGKLIDDEIGNKRMEVTAYGEAYTGDRLNVKGRRTRGGKIRSKIKKLIARKFHGQKRKSKNDTSNSSIDKIDTGKEKEHADDVLPCELEFEDDKPSLSSQDNGVQIGFEDTICGFRELPDSDAESRMVRKQVGREAGKISGCLIIFVIVLVGLLGSRVWAFALTLSWCLLLKSAGTLRRRMKCGPDHVSVSS